MRLTISNFGPILHRFWDTATSWLRITYFSYPSLIRRPRSLSSLWNFAAWLSVRKLESWGYTCGEGCMILTLTVFDWSTLRSMCYYSSLDPPVWQADGRRDRRTGDSI